MWSGEVIRDLVLVVTSLGCDDLDIALVATVSTLQPEGGQGKGGWPRL